LFIQCFLISSYAFSNSLFLLSWNFLSVSCTFWLAISSVISIKLSLIACRISSLRVFFWVSLGSLSQFIFFCWSLDLCICFLHFPLVPVLIYYWGKVISLFFSSSHNCPYCYYCPCTVCNSVLSEL
jgi:hypothetical protein